MFVVRSTGEWCHGVGLVVIGKGTVVVREGGRFLRVDAVVVGGALPSVRSAGYRVYQCRKVCARVPMGGVLGYVGLVS